MELSTILELCETNMSEGDYLEAAKLLKEKHKDNLETTNSINICFKISQVDMDDYASNTDELIIDKKFFDEDDDEFGHSYRIHYVGTDRKIIVKDEQLFEFLMGHFKLKLYCNFRFTYDDEVINDFYYGNFTSFFKERLYTCDKGDKYDKMSEEDLYDSYLDYSANRINEILDNVKNYH